MVCGGWVGQGAFTLLPTFSERSREETSRPLVSPTRRVAGTFSFSPSVRSQEGFPSPPHPLMGRGFPPSSSSTQHSGLGGSHGPPHSLREQGASLRWAGRRWDARRPPGREQLQMRNGEARRTPARVIERCTPPRPRVGRLTCALQFQLKSHFGGTR